jgi:hypothetical protein
VGPPSAASRWMRTQRIKAAPRSGYSSARGAATSSYIWHEGVFALRGTPHFFDRQGAVHARVSVDFAREFACLVEAPIPA